MSTSAPTEPVQLPPTVREYLVAHTARDVDAALRAFGVTGSVTDEGRTFRGTAEIRRFLSRAGADFHYTTELIGTQRIDDTHWVATQRLEGDFPGRVAELDYRFTLAEGLIAELVIAPR
jgi:hypothetical protein